MSRKHFCTGFLAAALVAIAVSGVYAAAFYAIVTPSNFTALNFTEQTTGDASVTFVTGAGAPPNGIGSLEFQIGSGGNNTGAGAALQLEAGWPVPLEHVVIRYSTYVQSGKHCDSKNPKKDGNDNAAVLLVLDVDTNNDNVADDVLIFDPAYNGEILCNTWQQWPATTGLWYSPKGGTFAAPGRPLAHYVYVHPGATIVTDSASGSGIALAAGFGHNKWKGFIGNADGLEISDPRPQCQCADGGMFCLPGTSGLYDFEPFEPN